MVSGSGAGTQRTDWSEPTLRMRQRLEASPVSDRVSHDRSTSALCTYRVGGPSALFLRVESVADLHDVHRAIDDARDGDHRCQTMVVGRGSNVLVLDRGFDGLILQLGPTFATVELPESGGTSVVAGGAALLPVVARQSAAAGLTGFEWAVGVPGSMGGAVRMNAGGHGSDMAESLVRVSVFDLHRGGPNTRSANELDLGYRHSSLRANEIVLSAELALDVGDAEESLAQVSDIVRWRREHQPGGQNAGSVFANPPGDSAGRLIDAAGLKGHRIGTAAVSEKHANFIQADPDGSADDVLAVIRHIQRVIADNDGIELHTENLVVGTDDNRNTVTDSTDL